MGAEVLNLDAWSKIADRTMDGKPNGRYLGRGFELRASDTTGAQGEKRQLCDVMYLLDLVKVEALRHGSPLRP